MFKKDSTDEKEQKRRLKELRKEQERKEKEEKKREKEEKKNEKEQAKNPNLNTTSPVSSPSTESKREIDVNNNTKTTPARPYQLIVVDGDETHDWCALFAGLKLKDGSPIRVIQASWLEIDLVVYSDSGCLLTIAPFRESENQIKRPNTLTIKPDFFIIRNQVRGPTPESDRLRILYGLMHAGVPAINSLESEYMNLERPIMFGALKQIERQLGHDKFPLIPQNYYSSYKNMIIPPTLPGIVKISHAHAGMGKIQIKDSTEFRDLSTVLALHHDYCTAEPYLEPEYGIRVQKIGSAYRVYKKIFTGSGWKSQFGGADLQVIPLTDEFKLWADECAKLFGGMDILAIDGLYANGKMHIIELNSTAIGIHRHYWEEDTKVLCELAVTRMSEIYVK